MIKKLTSIIINTRNGHQTINRAIRSAIDQSFKNIEIIVYDNASNPPINSVIEVVSNKLEIVRCNEALNLGEATSIRNELLNIYKNQGLISKKYNYVFTDKSLNNFFYLSIIKKIYPNAKIINCKRDIISSIMSIFQNNLTELAWAHNLENIFKYFDNYFKTIKNFDKMYPN